MRFILRIIFPVFALGIALHYYIAYQLDIQALHEAVQATMEHIYAFSGRTVDGSFAPYPTGEESEGTHKEVIPYVPQPYTRSDEEVARREREALAELERGER